MFYNWTGRDDGDAKGKRIHQVVQNTPLDEIRMKSDRSFGIVGFESDEGVRRNQGRQGAVQAPNQIRKFMSSIPYHSVAEDNLIDLGNVTCHGDQLEKAQHELGNHVAGLIKYGYTPIILGGGHETFYGHYLGVRKALGKTVKVGLVNLDAHLDMRLDEQPSSGTMFRQILEQDDQADYLCMGLQKLGNTKQLFETAKLWNVTYLLETELEPVDETLAVITEFAKKQDVVIYTICSDVINQAVAPGVSAPNPFGINPRLVRLITEHVVSQSNFLSFDISEVNPLVDKNDQTSRLASYMVADVLTTLNRKGGN